MRGSRVVAGEVLAVDLCWFGASEASPLLVSSEKEGVVSGGEAN